MFKRIKTKIKNMGETIYMYIELIHFWRKW